MSHPSFRSMINKIFRENPDKMLSLISIRKNIAENYPSITETSIKRWTKVALNKLETEGKIKRTRASYRLVKKAEPKKVADRIAKGKAKRVPKPAKKPAIVKNLFGAAPAFVPVNNNNNSPQKDLSEFKDRVPQSTGKDCGLTEIVFAFDTTGSMSGAIAQVKSKIIETTQRLFRDTPKIRIGLVAHGDYCDKEEKAFRMVDFLSNGEMDSLINFIKRDDLATSGGDGDENYEMVLEQVARGKFSWTEGSRRALVMIGDAGPHSPSVAKQQMITYGISNPREIDWKVEADECYKRGIKIYAVGVGRLLDFHHEIAARTCGTTLEMSGFESMADMVLALCFRETTEGNHYETFVKEVQAEGRMTSNMTRMVRKLSGSLVIPEITAIAV